MKTVKIDRLLKEDEWEELRDCLSAIAFDRIVVVQLFGYDPATNDILDAKSKVDFVHRCFYQFRQIEIASESVPEVARRLLSLCEYILRSLFPEDIRRTQLAKIQTALITQTKQQSEQIRQPIPAIQHSQSAEGPPEEATTPTAEPSRQKTPRGSSKTAHKALATFPPVDRPLPKEMLAEPFVWCPLLNYYSKDGSDTFKGKRLFCLLHFLADVVPFYEALRRHGAQPASCTFFFKTYPYPQRKAVEKYLAKAGCKVIGLDSGEDNAVISREFDSVRGDKQEIVILEDGGKLTPCMLEHYPELLARTVLVVEQTTRGARNINRALKGARTKPTFPLLSVAGCDLKAKAEPPFVADTIVESIKEMYQARLLRGKRIGLLGFGAIGQAIGRRLHNEAQVVVYDKDANKLLQAAVDGFLTSNSLKQAVRDKDWIIGTTGETSLDGSAFSILAHNTHLVSASSEQIEFGIKELLRRAESTATVEEHDGKCVGTRFRLADGSHREIVLVANGYPIGFWGKNGMPEPMGDLIMTVILLAALDGFGLPRKSQKELDNRAVNKIVVQRLLAERFAEFQQLHRL